MDSPYPKSAKVQRDERIGSVLGTDDDGKSNGGFFIFGESKKDAAAGIPSGSKSIGVNIYLWKGTLEVISFMPIAVSDPIGGIITTDWLEDLDGHGERYKIDVFVKSNELKAADLKVTVFKQVLRDHMWRDAKVNETIAQDMEDKILTRARTLKLAQEH